jgi:hypothetical protein
MTSIGAELENESLRIREPVVMISSMASSDAFSCACAGVFGPKTPPATTQLIALAKGVLVILIFPANMFDLQPGFSDLYQ